MTELLEAFKMSAPHTVNDPKCPFCPEKENNEHYKTYGGAKNSGSKLGKLVNDPTKFGTSTEADARPKDGITGKDKRQNQNFIDTDGEKLEQVKTDDAGTKFQAHHAISGNQCLKGDPVEKYIISGEKVIYDTGYSVNNPQNGIWLPSSAVGGAAWPTTDPAKKYAAAKEAMEKFSRQFHLGHHDIAADVDGLDPETDDKYVSYVKNQLADISSVLLPWEVCPEKDSKGKHCGNPRIHDMLDRVSSHILKRLKGRPKKWTFFVSRHARDFTIKARNPNAKLDWER